MRLADGSRRVATIGEFAAAIANVARLDTAAVSPESLLIADLGLDSLGVAELVVVLAERFDMAGLAASAGDRPWRTLTVADLFGEYLTGDAPSAEHARRANGVGT
ncbi:MAG: phosphopantetheine-binding protein [Solirubrobacteraceae bacterium]